MNSIWLGLAAVLLAVQITTSMVSPNLIRSCVNSTQVAAVDLAIFYGTDYLMVSKPSKCYIACIADASGITKDGKISQDFLQMANKPATHNRFKIMTEICDNLNVEGVCEATYEAFKCWLETRKHI